MVIIYTEDKEKIFKSYHSKKKKIVKSQRKIVKEEKGTKELQNRKQ